MKCSACGKTNLRSTTTVLIIPEGRRGRVCARCAKRGVLIVASLVAPVVTTEPAEQKSARELLAPFVKRCEGHAKAYATSKLEDADVRAEVWAAVASWLRTGRA